MIEEAKQKDISISVSDSHTKTDNADYECDWNNVSGKLNKIRTNTQKYRQGVENLLQKDVNLASHFQGIGEQSSNLNSVDGPVHKLLIAVFMLHPQMRPDPTSLSSQIPLRILWGQLNRRWERWIKSQGTSSPGWQIIQRLLKETQQLTEQTTTILCKAKDQMQNRYNIADINIYLKIAPAIAHALDTISDAIEQFKNAQLLFERMDALLDEQLRS